MHSEMNGNTAHNIPIMWTDYTPSTRIDRKISFLKAPKCILSPIGMNKFSSKKYRRNISFNFCGVESIKFFTQVVISINKFQ